VLRHVVQLIATFSTREYVICDVMKITVNYVIHAARTSQTGGAQLSINGKTQSVTHRKRHKPYTTLLLRSNIDIFSAVMATSERLKF